MFRPKLPHIISNDNCYSIVIAVSKHAREITKKVYENNQILEEKPVKTAVDELASGKYKIVNQLII